MPVLHGYAGNIMPQYIVNPSAPANTGAVPVDAAAAAGVPAVIDGTPVRVVVLALAGAAGLIALKLAGFRFSIGVSN
jgi:hypothetical protein